MRINFVLTIITLLFILGCSDSGDTPTSPGSGTGGVTLSVADVQIDENSNAVVTVTLSGASTADVIFSYTTSTGSASASDFTAASGLDTILAGTTSTTITITITDDGTVEANESFSFVISAPVNATISDGNATVTILDNDGVSFAVDVRPLIQNNGCLGSSCHGGSAGGLNLGLATYNQVRFGSGTNGPIINPGNSGASNLYLKLTPTPPFGSRMPLGQTALSTTDINKIRDWIDQGALNN